nr:reverse transcriptase domain-containing protein [Tanacetum cinerariifolium]
MRTRSQSRDNFPQQEASPAIVERLHIELPFLENQFQEDPPEDPPEVSMADNRTMVELLQAPTEGYEDAIVIPEIAKTTLSLSTHQLDTFYNALNVNNHDSLNSVAGGNFLDKMPRECLKIIEIKSKVRQSRAKALVSKVSTSSSTPAVSSEVAELKDLVRALLLDKKNQSSAPASSSTPAPVKAIEPNCVTCGGTHSYQNCPATSGNVYQDNIQECFLNTGRDLIDVHKGKLTLRIGNKAITYNLDQTVRYSANYNQMTTNKIDVIYEIYSQEVLSFSDVTASGNPTPYHDPVVSTMSPTLTLFRDSDFLLFEEAEAFLAILNSKPSPPLPNHKQHTPSHKKELKICEAKTTKSSVDEPPEVELKDLPPYLKYAFLEGDNKLPVIIAKELGDDEKSTLIKVLKSHKRAIARKLSDIQGSFTIVENEENELIPTRLVTGWRVCIDYGKLNKAPRKDHFPLSFMDQMLERLAGNEYYCFLDGFSEYFQIPFDPRDQEKTTFTSPYGTFAYRRMPFVLCNASGTFQRCMLAIFHDMVEKTMEVFMDDFSVFGNSFENCLSRLYQMLQRCEDTNLSLYWEKSHFMVKEGIVLGHKISKNEIEVDRAKVDVIAKLPHPTIVKVIWSFLGHVGFYRRFIQDFSKISRTMTHFPEKNTPFTFSEYCIKAFQTLKKKLTEALILIAPNWDLPFELCATQAISP